MEHTIALIEQSHQGDKSAREQLVKENLGLVWSIVRRYENRGHEREELFQIGSIGLLKAIDKFDTGYDVRFSTYAVPVISGEIKRFLRDDGLIKVSRTLKENGYRIRQAAEALTDRLGREPDLSEIGQATGLTVEEIVFAMDANVEVESIYKSVYQKDGSEIYLVDQVMDTADGVGCVQGKSGAAGAARTPAEEKILNRMLVEELLEGLEPTAQKLIKLRYYEDKAQTEVAKVLGISQVQVSRLEKKILLTMRSRLTK